MSDSEYEYEYDDNETETFYVNIDLTSCNGPIRPTRRRQSAPDPTETAASSPPQRAMSPDISERQQQEPPSQTQDPSNGGGSGNDIENRVQILDLHGDNPLVSYGNQIFSCEWADMIGTDMHFTRREADQSLDDDGIIHDDNNADPSFLKHGTNYSLIAANRIKIIGRKVNLVAADPEQHGNLLSSTAAANTETQQQQQQQQEDQKQAEAGGLTGKTAQVRFLQELMDIKRAKGEKDMVLNRKRGQRFDDKVTRWAQTEERLNMIHQLNRDALTGDVNATKKLEELYDMIDRGVDSLAPALPASLAPQGTVENAPSG
ncbi:hypothetical protein PISL3812_01895 [Talaromyces islandicus]|uniref:Transcription factor TFIIIC triple barrel domain-containing protein n=1 Tax=Talaromyces islandicus TaxID=28573 RepID=A0A0U1LNC2_TALIS|nr:hypothetical protein PISL3812_01895 [Talaromyces islandicus]